MSNTQQYDSQSCSRFYDVLESSRHNNVSWEKNKSKQKNLK